MLEKPVSWNHIVIIAALISGCTVSPNQILKRGPHQQMKALGDMDLVSLCVIDEMDRQGWSNEVRDLGETVRVSSADPDTGSTNYVIDFAQEGVETTMDVHVSPSYRSERFAFDQAQRWLDACAGSN